MTYEQHATNLQTVLSRGGDFTAPSPCAGWSAADVVDHLIDTQRDFLAGHDIDLGPRPDGDPPGEGICGRPVPVAADATRQDRLLATLGRRS